MIELVDKIKELMTEADNECTRLGKEETRIGYKSYLKEYNYNKGKRNAYTNVLKMIGAIYEYTSESPYKTPPCPDCENNDPTRESLPLICNICGTGRGVFSYGKFKRKGD